MYFKRIFFALLIAITALPSIAQELTEKADTIANNEVAAIQEHVEMADGLRQSGKIYVVVVVVFIVFAGIVLYLMRLDKKITRLEKEIKSNE